MFGLVDDVFVILSLSLAVVMLMCFLAGMVVVACVVEARDWRRRRKLLDDGSGSVVGSDVDASRDYSRPRVVP